MSMFVYLTKRMAMPHNANVCCVSWSQRFDFIGCGGDGGNMKVFRMETVTGDGVQAKGLAAPTQLTMNQTLPGHRGAVQVVQWNERYQKLATADDTGLITVWSLYKGQWFEDMINDRLKSTVKGIKWTSDGKRICIVYEDGHVILGSMTGSRLWGKNLADVTLCSVEWSPDNSKILIGLASGQVHVYDDKSKFITKLPVPRLSHGVTGSVRIVGLEWYDGRHGYLQPGCPSLAVCWENGHCQLMRHEGDQDPILLDTGVQLVQAAWSANGTLLAVAGSQRVMTDGGEEEANEVNVVHFYTPLGDHVRTLSVPGKTLTSISWDASSLRIALGVDNFIYFANIRPFYHWGYCNNTVIYSTFKPAHAEHCVVFWDIKNNRKYTRSVKDLTRITACGDYCCVVSKAEEGQHRLLVFNTIGTPMDKKFIEMEPEFLTMTKTHIVAACKEAFFCRQFKDPKKLSNLDMATRRKLGGDKLVHIDEFPSGSSSQTAVDFSKADTDTDDPICCLCASDKVLIVGRQWGTLMRYDMPSVTFTHKYNINKRPLRLALNNISTRLAIIDVRGQLTFFNLDTRVAGPKGKMVLGETLSLTRKDCWDVKWAEDNSTLCAVMEKTRLYIFHGLQPEEYVLSSGYLCQFIDLQVKAVMLDEVMKEPDNPAPDNVVVMEMKCVRDTRALMAKDGLTKTMIHVQENPHPRLWRLMAESALEQLDLQVAEVAFAKYRDYPGIQFVKRLHNVKSDNIKKAQVAAYLRRYDEAEKLYIDMDRLDLAVDLRKMLGDWDMVIELLKGGGGGGDDTQLEEAYNAKGDDLADLQDWRQAVEYYKLGRNQERVAQCYYMLEDYDGMDELLEALPEKHKLLPELARRFESVGMCEQAVDAYLKYDDAKMAINTCVSLNHWDLAIELAKAHKVPGVEPLLANMASQLLQQKKVLPAVHLYRKAGLFMEAAKLLFKIAQDQKAARPAPPIMLFKKLYVLGGLLVEQYHDAMKFSSDKKATTCGRAREASRALAGFLAEDLNAEQSDTKALDNAWRGAEAYHWYILAQRQLHRGDVRAAMTTAMTLRDYDDLLDPVDVYSLLALAASAHRAYGVCSQAFTKLESLPGLREEQRQQYEELASDIFTKHRPKDIVVLKVKCNSCGARIPDWLTTCPICDARFPICVATGRPILEDSFWRCPQCKHCALQSEIVRHNACPLCHEKL